MCDPAVLTRLYLDVLTQRLGLPATSDPDSALITFRAHDLTYVLAPRGADNPEGVRVELPIPAEVFDSLTNASQQTVLQALHTVNRTMFAATVTLRDGYLVARSDLLLAAPDTLPSPEMITAVVPSACRTLLSAVIKFNTELEFTIITSDPDLATTFTDRPTDRTPPDTGTQPGHHHPNL